MRPMGWKNVSVSESSFHTNLILGPQNPHEKYRYRSRPSISMVRCQTETGDAHQPEAPWPSTLDMNAFETLPQIR